MEGSKIESWRGSGRLLGASWAAPGSKTPPRVPLGPPSAPLWLHFVPQDAPHKPLFRDPFFGYVFRQVFNRFWVPFRRPKSSNMAWKSMPGRLPCSTSFWDRFFNDFGFQDPPPKHPCESNYDINIKLKLPIHKNRRLPIHIEIWLHLGAIWASFWHQKSTNVEVYSPPRGYQKRVKFL